jgi:hypothetical protein
MREYVKASSSPESFADYLQRYVRDCKVEADYHALVGMKHLASLNIPVAA